MPQPDLVGATLSFWSVLTPAMVTMLDLPPDSAGHRRVLAVLRHLGV